MIAHYTKAAVFMLPVLVVACGNGGPSESDVEAAMNKKAAAVAALFGQSTQDASSIDVKDMDCTKASEDTFDCEVLAEVGGEETTDKVRFSKLWGDGQYAKGVSND